MSKEPTCQHVMSSEGDADTLCGKPATHHIPESDNGTYRYRETDTHLCVAHADEAKDSGQEPIRRWRNRPPEGEKQ